MDQLEEDSFSREETQKEIDAVLISLCGEFPGAVTVRHSYKRFKRLALPLIDPQENQVFDREKALNPEMTQSNATSGRGNAAYDRDADHEMMDSDAVGGSSARRDETSHLHFGEDDEDTVDLDRHEWGMSWVRSSTFLALVGRATLMLIP